MPKYVILFNWTDQGVASVKDTVKRFQEGKSLVESKGAKVESIHWTMGAYDAVAIAEGPDDETIVALGLTFAAEGDIRVTTMRAFDENEMKGILSKMG